MSALASIYLPGHPISRYSQRGLRSQAQTGAHNVKRIKQYGINKAFLFIWYRSLDHPSHPLPLSMAKSVFKPDFTVSPSTFPSLLFPSAPCGTVRSLLHNTVIAVAPGLCHFGFSYSSCFHSPLVAPSGRLQKDCESFSDQTTPLRSSLYFLPSRLRHDLARDSHQTCMRSLLAGHPRMPVLPASSWMS